MVLMRLFQTSRRFNVEIQPQLVLLQKTLLNIEGLGRQLDPDLDLWNTAKPFLERWMHEQVGWRELLERLHERGAALRQAAARAAAPAARVPAAQRRRRDRRELLELLAEQRRTNRLLQALIYGGIGFALGADRDADRAACALIAAVAPEHNCRRRVGWSRR